MKIKSSDDFSVIPVERTIRQAKSDALLRQAESVRLTLVQVVQISSFVNDLPVNLFPESQKEVQA